MLFVSEHFVSDHILVDLLLAFCLSAYARSIIFILLLIVRVTSAPIGFSMLVS